ncbi:tetratricopeptide repeat protein [Acetilactobacillus jinshanensis]|uniref:Tetratricopeptide repeat protein n=1 Tax=Acetilactobacillus jinshanensis TaxID=1720083 RepID=A0A4P6ZJK3_9LACO|nr:tetratricopeptide repeat protein [Acetilactobacillus jinshanensis]QBP17911.1 tetratricopeptide repeat protein [Acetilactobacillus jinshanensis]URL60774.1 tetratricopeptide repeat protein [uncultured bacterium]
MDNKKIQRKQALNQIHEKRVAEKRKQAQHRAAVTLHRLIKDIDTHPHNYHTYYDLGTFLVELHNYVQAEELFMKALGLFKNRSQEAKDTLIYGLANVYYAAGSFDKAIKYFNQVKEPKLKLNAYIMLAQSYMSKKDYKRAVVFALTAQGFRKQDPVINRLLGENLQALGNFRDAARFYKVALQADPTNGPVYFNQGICHMVLGIPFSKDFELAEKYNPKYVKKGQKRLADIERFIQVNDGKGKKRSTKKDKK